MVVKRGIKIYDNFNQKVLAKFKHEFINNKTQYDWFPGRSQNSKKFSAKFKQNPSKSKNHSVFLNILGG